jgi:hypothetical protein
LCSQNTPTSPPTYDWVWAVSGGGQKNINDNRSAWKGHYLDRAINFEQVVDVKVDKDNNSYILAIIGQSNTQFNGQPIEVYNYEGFNNSASDVLLISLDCNGNTRWTQVIGGSGYDYAYSIGLDNNEGLYVGLIIENAYSSTEVNPYNRMNNSVHFDKTTQMPYVEKADRYKPHPGFKSLALAKYKTTDGSFQWVQYPEGLIPEYSQITGHLGGQVNNITYSANKIVTENDGTTHWMVALRPGTYLNGLINIKETKPFYYYHEYWVIVYNANGTVKRALKMPLTTNDNMVRNTTDSTYNIAGEIFPFQIQPKQHFWYDSIKKQYYLTGYLYEKGYGFKNPSFDGTHIPDGGYIVAFDTNGKKLWRVSANATLYFVPGDVKTDQQGEVYLTGNVAGKWDNDKQVYIEGYFGNTKINGESGKATTMKLNPTNGKIDWINLSTPKLTNTGTADGLTSSGERLTISNTEVIVASSVGSATWDSFDPGMNIGDYSNPAILRFDKKDGKIKALHKIEGVKVVPSALLAVEMDKDGNFITGGYFASSLFYQHPKVSMLTNKGGNVDFFIAKLAATDCGTPVLSNDKWESIKPKLFPNPTKNKIYWASEVDWRYFELYDIAGKTVLNGDASTSQIDCSNLSNGTYILALFDYQGRRVNEKIVVNK